MSEENSFYVVVRSENAKNGTKKVFEKEYHLSKDVLDDLDIRVAIGHEQDRAMPVLVVNNEKKYYGWGSIGDFFHFQHKKIA